MGEGGKFYYTLLSVCHGHMPLMPRCSTRLCSISNIAYLYANSERNIFILIIQLHCKYYFPITFGSGLMVIKILMVRNSSERWVNFLTFNIFFHSKTAPKSYWLLILSPINIKNHIRICVSIRNMLFSNCDMFVSIKAIHFLFDNQALKGLRRFLYRSFHLKSSD